MKSFESESLYEVDLERMHQKALDILENSRIHEEDFIDPKGPYSPGSVERDIQHVAKKEQEFKDLETDISKENKRYADILEAIILEHGELSEWFGENAFTHKTSKFDDYENGVDALIEFREKDSKAASYVGLGVDITFGADTGKKFERIKKQIDGGKLARVKYFHSDYTNFHGQLSKLPEVIIGADKRTLRDLADKWINKEQKELANHKIQMMILKQMAGQLRTFAEYASSVGQEEAASIYDDRYRVIQSIIQSKYELNRNLGTDLNNDQVHYGIMSILEEWQSQISSKDLNAA